MGEPKTNDSIVQNEQTKYEEIKIILNLKRYILRKDESK